MTTFVSSLRNEILSSTISRFKLESDLRNLDKVYACGASDAVVFYSARILESILKDAHLQFFGEDNDPGAKKPTLADIEKELFDYNLLRNNRYYWAKGLRLLGNEARHSLRRATTEEADCALIFLEFILNWYFCEFPLGQRQTTIYKGQSTLSRTAGNRLLDLAWTLDSSRLNPLKLKAVFGPYEHEYLESFSKNFAFPLLLIEVFTDQGDHDSAGRLIDALTASGRRPKGALNNRFQQLKGLHLSRMCRFDEALKLLESEYTKQRNERQAWVEDETVGILGGVYKRIWDSNKDDGHLAKSHETYRWGWRRSKNTYLGINAATTALWLDNISEAKQIAGEVKSTLIKRRAMIKSRADSRYDLNYWDLATLAESHLLAGESAQAAELYSFAFTTHSKNSESISVTKKQLARIIEHLQLAPTEIALLKDV